MSGEVLSEQSYVCEGAGYDEVYPSSQDNPSTSYSKRVLYAHSPSEDEDEDSDVDGTKNGTYEDSDGKENVENVESPIRFVIGPDGLRKFFLPLM